MNYYTDRFITVTKGMCGYFVILADASGPIERLDCCNYPNPEKAEEFASELAIAYNVKYLK